MGSDRSPSHRAADAVRADGLVVTYGDHVALESDHLQVPVAVITAVIGPNGSGKSTLLAAISGIVEPAAGTIEVLGQRPGATRGRVAHVLQDTTANAAVPLTVREIVRMGRYARRGPFRPLTVGDHRAVDQALERLQIRDLQRRHLSELSAGQRQRVYVAQGLAQEADLVLLDEPATGLDLPSQAQITAIMRELVAAGRTVIHATHSVTEAADADHVVLLATRVVGSGTPAKVLQPHLLQAAYGGQVHVTADGAVMIDDPHHPH
ncbi:MAG: ATP-binding cassette domain-containing protein [Actinobacteria bacterium]|nr:ATP-binding cassette domain-containing protein [Actinomycetota bacterium]